MPHGGVAQFFPAGVVPDIASGVIAAALEGRLHKSRLGMVAPCLKIIHALASTGEVALFDEATGYQYHRAPDALQELIGKLLRQPMDREYEMYLAGSTDCLDLERRMRAWDHRPKLRY